MRKTISIKKVNLATKISGMSNFIEQGGICTLVGQTGSGKTSMLEHFALLGASSGKKVVFCSTELGEKEVNGRLSKASKYPLFKNTVTQNIKVGNFTDNNGKVDVVGLTDFCTYENASYVMVDAADKLVYTVRTLTRKVLVEKTIHTRRKIDIIIGENAKAMRSSIQHLSAWAYKKSDPRCVFLGMNANKTPNINERIYMGHTSMSFASSMIVELKRYGQKSISATTLKTRNSIAGDRTRFNFTL